MTTETILPKTAFIAALAALTTGCQGLEPILGSGADADSGPGYETSFSCHADNGHDIEIMGEFTTPATRILNSDSGLGGGLASPLMIRLTMVRQRAWQVIVANCRNMPTSTGRGCLRVPIPP
ncbi:hypothetical protein Hneap_2296 [Halothiobacillus neapolitanus c2]|uniref:Uncharacterized protein n=1 Tax=Halothiobacillus neapolitanus (strain ATCC 23641 / DSM 15147 / CIP 104769 / NCIMB 8539 / c2) TaxID=555778 RepID=D0KWY6_HALNC|nr:hypothetical protein Hneap_2296 [Halothiobacillus neapolitanus c2]TDN57486.1 hypothetical protein C8D83_1133 [Halothiobacillus neapolitanus]